MSVEVIVVGDIKGIKNVYEGLQLILIPCEDLHVNIRRNLGIQHSNAPRLAFLDDDSIPRPGWVQEALKLCPTEKRFLTGPEYPIERGKISSLIYAVCKNRFCEGDKAHFINKRACVSWLEVPFCNLIAPRLIIDQIGLPATDIPWDVDDIEFCFRARPHVVFENIPELAIYHDRYPDSIRSFLSYKWRRRVRTGEKLISYPHLYFRKTPVVIGACLPWVILTIAIAFSMTFSIASKTLIMTLLILYMTLLLSQVGPAYRFGGWYSVFPYLGLLSSIHLVSFTGVQWGILKSLCSFRRGNDSAGCMPQNC
jgi:hypothetical protein